MRCRAPVGRRDQLVSRGVRGREETSLRLVERVRAREASVLITVGVGMAVVLAGGTLTLGAGGVGAGVAWALVVLVVAALLKRSAERTSLADR